jgi:hypothetical protein
MIKTTAQLLKDPHTQLVIKLPGGEYGAEIDKILNAPLPELINLIPDKIYLTSTISDKVKLEARLMKDKMDIRTAQLYLTLKKSAKDSGEKITEDHLKNLIATDKDLSDMKKAMNELNYYKDRLQSALNTILAKKDLLEISLRSSGGGDPFVSNLPVEESDSTASIDNPRKPALSGSPF